MHQKLVHRLLRVSNELFLSDSKLVKKKQQVVNQRPTFLR